MRRFELSPPTLASLTTLRRRQISPVLACIRHDRVRTHTDTEKGRFVWRSSPVERALRWNGERPRQHLVWILKPLPRYDVNILCLFCFHVRHLLSQRSDGSSQPTCWLCVSMQISSETFAFGRLLSSMSFLNAL